MPIYIDPQSSIKKIYFVVFKYGEPQISNIFINSLQVDFNNNASNFPFKYKPNTILEQQCYAVIKELDSSQFSINSLNTINIDVSQNIPIYYTFSSYYIILLYENFNMTTINFRLMANNQNMDGYEKYKIKEINPINFSNPVGFA